MRVITGSAKGRQLKEVPGETTRPITDRAKEALFSILEGTVINARFLDLFGGTGAVGIEALSRGAAYATFIEKAPAAYRVLVENLRLTNLAGRAEVIRGDAFKVLAGPPLPAYDFIYIAPPQYQELWQRAITIIDDQPAWLQSDGWVIVQIYPKEFVELPLRRLHLTDRRQYGSVMLCFYQVQ